MAFKTPEQKCNDIVIGHSLQAFLYSYLNGYPIITNKQFIDNSFDFCESDLPLESIGLENAGRCLKAKEGSIQVGAPKSEIRWQSELFYKIKKILHHLYDGTYF